MKLNFPDLPRFWFADVVGGVDEAEDVKSNEDGVPVVAGDSDDDDKVGKNRVIEPEDGMLVFRSSVFLGGMFNAWTVGYSRSSMHC
jgi:hypothetical protein